MRSIDVKRQGAGDRRDQIGLDASKFDSHSMRSGWTSTAAKNVASLWKMKEISRHAGANVLAGYIREAELPEHASVGMY
jgi:hypothetical protein